MYSSVDQALYRAFNVSELIYQRNPLASLYRAPYWDSKTRHTNHQLTVQEKILADSKVLHAIQQSLPGTYYCLLRMIYCRSLDVQEWRELLKNINPMIAAGVGRIRFNPQIYEYTCIKQLTGNKLKSIYINNNTVRRNSKRVCAVIKDMTNSAHEQAERLLENYGLLYADNETRISA